MKGLVAALLLVLPLAVSAQMQGSNYNIWVDTIGSGGGSTQATEYSLDTIVGAQAPGVLQSAQYSARSGIQGIDPEPVIGFTVTTSSIDFGKLTPLNTVTGTITATASTNMPSGYRIRIVGNPLGNIHHTVAAIGPVPASSIPGTEQFGVNVVANTSPAVGANPSGGSGQATAPYATPNMFAFENNAIIAQSNTFSEDTTYTISVITNIAPNTTMGSYTTSLGFSLVATY